MDNHVVHCFTKNDNEEIRLTLRKYKERHYIDVRLFFQPEDKNEMVPSKKGLTVGIEFVPELKRGLIKFDEVFRQMVVHPKELGKQRADNLVED